MYRAKEGDADFEHKTNFLFVKPAACGWMIAWWLAESAEEGADLYPDPDFDADDEDDDDAMENQLACAAVAKLDTTHEDVSDGDDEDDDEDDIFFWTSKEDAEKACAVAMVAVLAYRENPKWAPKAIAAGWTPPNPS